MELDNNIKQVFEAGLVSEVLLIDWKNEGRARGFDLNLIKQFPYSKIPLIAFGGLNDTMTLTTLLKMPQIKAVGLGNFLNYKEHCIQTFKGLLNDSNLRPPEFQAY